MSAPQDTLRIQTPDNVGIGYATAGLGSRMLAQLLDSLLAGLAIVAIITGYLGATAHAMDEGSLQSLNLEVVGALGAGFFVYFGYFAVSEMSTGGGTVGKSALGLRVMRMDGGRPRMTHLLIRNMVRILDVAGVGLLVMFFHPSTRRLGDLAAGTLVVRTRPAVSLASVSQPAPMLLRTPDAGPPIEGVAGLGAHEHGVLRTFLSRRNLTPDQREKLAGRLAGRLQERLGLAPTAPERGWPPELFLERLYLQLDRRLS